MAGYWLRVDNGLLLRNEPKMAGWELGDGQLRAENGQVDMVRTYEMSGY